MKPILATAIIALVTSTAAFADQYSVFRICEDKHVLHTSDGADAGHVEYIVVDPGEQRIVSTVVTGGVIGERHVVVPFSEMRFGADREVTFTQITRERFVSAPVIETTRFTSTSYVEPSVIEPTFTHFGVSFNRGPGFREGGADRREVERAATDRGNAERLRQAADANRTDVNVNVNGPGGDPRRMREGADARRDERERSVTGNPGRPGARGNDPRREGDAAARTTAGEGRENTPGDPAVQSSKRSPARGTGGAAAVDPAGEPKSAGTANTAPAGKNRAPAREEAAGQTGGRAAEGDARTREGAAAPGAEKAARARGEASDAAGHARGAAAEAGDAAGRARGAASEAGAAARAPGHEAPAEGAAPRAAGTRGAAPGKAASGARGAKNPEAKPEGAPAAQ